MKKLETILLSVITFLFVSGIADSFLRMASFNQEMPVYVYILALILFFTVIKNTLVLIGSVVFSILVLLYTYLQYYESFSTWLIKFLQRLPNYVSYVFSGSASHLPNPIGIILISLFLAILLYLIIKKRNWKLPFILQMGYYLLLIGINYIRLTNQIVVFIFTTFLIASMFSIDQTIHTKKRTKILVGLTVLLSVFLANATIVPSTLPVTYQKIQTQTIDLRKDLSTNLYRTLDEIGEATGFTLRSGFSENDSYLGGPLTNNRRLVFETQQIRPNYWRIESKEIYTGTGWETDAFSDESINENLIIDQGYHRYSSHEESIIFTFSRDNISYIPIPYGYVQLQFSDNYQSILQTLYSKDNLRIRTTNLAEDQLNEVKISFKRPEYYESELRNSSATSILANNPYTQLPDTLPQRVIDLAKNLTSQASNDYEKIQLIESYLYDRKNFSYTISQAEYVPTNRDYVDFFLFDSKRGYCEHFASSMVVMLRALDIQARWAKGYAPGQSISLPSSSELIYRINESHAHTWPEVYFEGIGWIPFEPTPAFALGFDGPSIQPADLILDDNDDESQDNNDDPNNNPDDSFGPDNPNDPANPNIPDEQNPSDPSLLPDLPQPKDNPVPIIVNVLLLLLIGFGYVFKDVFAMMWLLRKLESNREINVVELHKGIVRSIESVEYRNISTTLSEFVHHTSWVNQQKNLVELTKKVESIIYGQIKDYKATHDEKTLAIDIIKQCKEYKLKQIRSVSSKDSTFASLHK